MEWRTRNINVAEGVPARVVLFPGEWARTIESIGVPTVRAIVHKTKGRRSVCRGVCVRAADEDDARFAIRWAEARGEQAAARDEARQMREEAVVSRSFMPEPLAEALRAANVDPGCFAGRCCVHAVGRAPRGVRPADVAGIVQAVLDRFNTFKKLVSAYFGGQEVALLEEEDGPVCEFISFGGWHGRRRPEVYYEQTFAAGRSPAFVCSCLVMAVHAQLKAALEEEETTDDDAARRRRNHEVLVDPGLAAIAVLEVARGMPPPLVDAELAFGGRALRPVLASRPDLFGVDRELGVVWLRLDGRDGTVHTCSEIEVGRRFTAVDNELRRRGLPRLHLVLGDDSPGDWQPPGDPEAWDGARVHGIDWPDRRVLEHYMLGQCEPRHLEARRLKAAGYRTLAGVRERAQQLGLPRAASYTARTALVDALLDHVEAADTGHAAVRKGRERSGPVWYSLRRAVIAVDKVADRILARCRQMQEAHELCKQRGIWDELFEDIVLEMDYQRELDTQLNAKQVVKELEQTVWSRRLKKALKAPFAVCGQFFAQPAVFARRQPEWRKLSVAQAKEQALQWALGELERNWEQWTLASMEAEVVQWLMKRVNEEWPGQVAADRAQCQAQVDRIVALLLDAGVAPRQALSIDALDVTQAYVYNWAVPWPIVCELWRAGEEPGTEPRPFLSERRVARLGQRNARLQRELEAAGVQLAHHKRRHLSTYAMAFLWRTSRVREHDHGARDDDDDDDDPFAALPMLVRLQIIGRVHKLDPGYVRATYRYQARCSLKKNLAIASPAMALGLEIWRNQRKN